MVTNKYSEMEHVEEWNLGTVSLLEPNETVRSALYGKQEDEEIVASQETSLTTRDVLKKFISKVRRAHPLKIVWVFILILLVTIGNAMQIIGLNFWLLQFPAGGTPGNFTTLAVSALFFGMFFLIMFLVYFILKRPSLRFVCNKRGWWLLFLIGLMDAVNSSMAIYAASHTPEVLQALFTSLVPVYAAMFTKWLLKDPRVYCNRWILSSFALIIIGIVLAAASQFSHSFVGDDKDTVWWCLIFFFSVPPTVLMNIWQSMYMIEFTYDPSFDDTFFASEYPHVSDLTTSEGSGAITSASMRGASDREQITANIEVQPSTNADTPQADGNNPIPPYQGEDTIVKIIMLAAETNIQFLIILALLPMDALPWWGGSSSVSGAWDNFTQGVHCVFESPDNFKFCIVYTMGFVFTYLGSAYLNQYSVTLCSMIGQLSSPITALLLIIVPSWNVEKGYTPWYMSLVAAVILSIGSIIYTLWEEMTEDEKVDGERKLKAELLSKMRMEHSN